jgi:hypothetical protein
MKSKDNQTTKPTNYTNTNIYLELHSNNNFVVIHCNHDDWQSTRARAAGDVHAAARGDIARPERQLV